MSTLPNQETPAEKKLLSRAISNKNLVRQPGKLKGKHKSGNFRIIKLCLSELLALQQLGFPNSSIIDLISSSFNHEFTPKHFSANLSLAQRKLNGIAVDLKLVNEEVLQLTTNYRNADHTEIATRLTNKGAIYRAKQRKVSVRRTEPTPAPQPAPRVEEERAIKPSVPAAPSQTRPTSKPNISGSGYELPDDSKEVDLNRFLGRISKALLTRINGGFDVTHRDTLSRLFKNYPDRLEYFQQLETNDRARWIEELLVEVFTTSLECVSQRFITTKEN